MVEKSTINPNATLDIAIQGEQYRSHCPLFTFQSCSTQKPRTVLSFVINVSNWVQVQEPGKVAERTVEETVSSAIEFFVYGLDIACIERVCIPGEHVGVPGVKRCFLDEPGTQVLSPKTQGFNSQ